MKKITVIFFLLISSSVFCQIVKYTSFEFGVSEKVDGYFYSPKFEKQQTIIVLDAKQSTLSFFGRTEFRVDIYKAGKNYNLKNGDQIIEFYVIDDEGKKCLARLRALKDKSQRYTHQISLIYSNMQVVYNGY